MNRIKEWLGEIHPALVRIILVELIVLAVLLILLAITGAARAETSSTAGAGTYVCVVHKGEWVWIRSEPSKTAHQIGRVRYGYEIEAGEPENGFLRIDVKPGWLLEGESATVGYVDASYFDRPTPETMYRVICEGPLAKRETPAGRLICWIKPGVKISVLGWRYAPDGSLWAKVFKGGYVKSTFLGEL